MELVIQMQLIPSFYYTIILFNIFPFRICQRIVFKFINLTVNVLQIYYGVCYLITFHKIISKYFLHNITRFYIKLYHSMLTILQSFMCCIIANTINMVKIKYKNVWLSSAKLVIGDFPSYVVCHELNDTDTTSLLFNLDSSVNIQYLKFLKKVHGSAFQGKLEIFLKN